ncbi:MAG: glycosyltransferase family 39 protein, partial [Candidatus Omnitrophica bacterium]|nr:glycosyltransferase family 39 protein [Candidatus Omnitrophota bacterium]
RLLAGEIPYKDFFIVMYPPGQIYILGAIFKLFASSLIAGRIYTVSISAVISMLVFFITRILTANPAVSIFSWLMVLTSLSPRLGAIPSPIWPGMLLGILSIYIFIRYLKNPKSSSIFIAGLAVGATILFRHDIGIFAALSILLPLLIEALNKKSVKNIISFVSAISFVTIPWVAFFFSVSASKDIFNSLVAFTFIHEKTAALPFPKPCFDLNMIFHGSLHFINVNQFYLPILVYGYTLIYLLARAFRHSWRIEAKGLSILSILSFGICTFNQVRIRADAAHLLTVLAPAMILSAFILHDAFSSGFKFKLKYIARYAASLVIATLLGLLLIKNVDKYIKNTYIKVYRNDIVKVRFERGTLYLPKEEAGDVLSTIKFIKENTGTGDRIYIGNMAHWKDDFGGSTILYFLADRLPSTKFYELLPGLITNKEVQLEIRDSLIHKDVKLIVLQDVEKAGQERSGVPEERRMLDDFIQREYKAIARFGKYNIYKRIPG